jgi:chemotaxis signal transduction protein
LVAEQVSDLTYTQPDQVMPVPVQLPQTPYLDGIIQSDQGILQLIAVEKIWDAALGGTSLREVLESGPQRVTVENAETGAQ